MTGLNETGSSAGRWSLDFQDGNRVDIGGIARGGLEGADAALAQHHHSDSPPKCIQRISGSTSSWRTALEQDGVSVSPTARNREGILHVARQPATHPHTSPSRRSAPVTQSPTTMGRPVFSRAIEYSSPFTQALGRNGVTCRFENTPPRSAAPATLSQPELSQRSGTGSPPNTARR